MRTKTRYRACDDRGVIHVVSRRTNRGAFAAAVGVLVLGSAACALVTSYDGLEGPGVSDASSEATVRADGAGCALKHAPEKVATDDDRTSSAYVGALSTLTLDKGDRSAPDVGLDLDQRCTCPDAPSCKSQLPPVCDADGGVDNGAADLFGSLSADPRSLSPNAAAALGLASGSFGLVFRLSGYSGRPDDSSVVFEVLNATGVVGGASPKFDGADSWVLDATTLDNGVSRFSSFSAWVRDGVLVAPFPKLQPKLRFPTTATTTFLVDVEINDAIVTGRVGVTAGGGLTLTDGQIVGRVRASSWLLQFQRAGRCSDAESILSIRALTCGRRDIAVNAARDNADATCDALSFAIAFGASPALVESTTAIPVETPSPCEMDGGHLDPTFGCPTE